MDGQTDIGVDPSEQHFYNASLTEIRAMIDQYGASKIEDEELDHSKKHSDKKRAMKKANENQDKLEAKNEIEETKLE